ncbi:MAG TPA: hypothetical protein VFI41_04755 [Gemmatimonadales bacterium]|nr:hypothetical protein [Gemmatimonadales bacterium]
MKKSGWRRQEERTARLYGGRRQPGSGAHWSRKGDVVTPELLIENKWRGNNQITLKGVDLAKNCDEATAEGKIPAFAIELADRRYVLFTEEDVLEHFVDRLGAPRVAGQE